MTASRPTCSRSTAAWWPSASLTLLGTAATGNTVLVSFTTFDPYSEFLVRAVASPNAVQSPTGTPSPDSGAPIGANAGARASGYTTAPDGIAATFQATTATVTVDARLGPGPVPADFRLLDAQGALAATGVNAAATLNGAPGPTVLTVTFRMAGDVADARAITLLPGTDPVNHPNILQTIGR